MLIIALALAVIGLAALVFAVVTSNALVAWVCIGASALGVILLTVDALRDRNRQRSESAEPAEPSSEAEPASEADTADTDAEEPVEEPDEVDADDDADQDTDQDTD